MNSPDNPADFAPPKTVAPNNQFGGRNAVLIVVAVAVTSFAIVAAITLSHGPLTPIRPDASRKLYELNGHDDMDGDQWFQASPGWEVHYEFSNQLSQVRWIGEDGHVGSIGNAPGKPLRNGSNVQVSTGGKFRLGATGKGPWKLSAWQISAVPATPDLSAGGSPSSSGNNPSVP